MLVFLARLVMLLIAISAIKSAINFVQRVWFGIQEPRSVARPAPKQAGASVLHQDPVCGTYVAADGSLKKIVHGRVIHFCSPQCRDRYTV